MNIYLYMFLPIEYLIMDLSNYYGQLKGLTQATGHD